MSTIFDFVDISPKYVDAIDTSTNRDARDHLAAACNFATLPAT